MVKTSAKQEIITAFNLREHHHEAISDFTKALHALDIDVKDHAKKLGLEEAELKELEEEFEKANFLKKTDKRKLRKILKELTSAIGELVAMEVNLWSGTRPFTQNANYLRLVAKNVNSLELLKKIHKRGHKKTIDDLKTRIPKIRKWLLASMSIEHSGIRGKYGGIFPVYSKLLNKIEKNCKSLIDLENSWGKKGGDARLKLFRVHDDLRKILHDDIQQFSHDLIETYDIRLNVYEWLISADKKLSKRTSPTLEKEYTDLYQIQKNYLKAYKAHAERISELYSELGGEV